MSLAKVKKNTALTQHLEEYEYLREGRVPGLKGRFFDVDMFCYTLSCCLTEDGVLSEYITPQHLYQFTFEVIEHFSQSGYSPEFSQTVEKYVSYQEIPEWENLPDIAKDIYPVAETTQFHAALLAEPSFRSFWIYCIGSTLIGSPLAQGDIPNSDFVNKPTQYFAWIKPEWTFSFKFMSGFHTACSDWLREFDKHVAQKGGSSLMETLAVSMITDEDYASVSERLEKRNKLYLKRFDEIKTSMDKECYREAVALQEGIISNCIKDYLKVKSRVKKGANFNTLVKNVLNLRGTAGDKKAVEIFTEVDIWRPKRNNIIHDTIEASLNDTNVISPKETAEEGLEICQKICDWYYEEATMYWNLYRDETEQLN